MSVLRYQAVEYPAPRHAAPVAPAPSEPVPSEPAPADAAPSGTRAALDTVAPYLLALMVRNVSSDGFRVADPLEPGRFSAPGCIIASPSYPENSSSVDQDYVFNWTRDAAITAMELAAANLPTEDGICQPLVDYVEFAVSCQLGAPTIARACYTVEGDPRPWTDQSDGPALQISALLQLLPQVDLATVATLEKAVTTNVDFLLAAYREPTTNLWEEVHGFSFFARAVQVRAFDDLITNTAGIPVPAGVSAARDQLSAALDQHWTGELFVSVLTEAPVTPGAAPSPVRPGYDPNIDIVLAALYGGISPTDPRILATASMLRAQWSDPASAVYYPINGADADRGLGPLLGRYPQDVYDGDVTDPVPGGHPWAVCTAALADLYYRVAAATTAAATVTIDPLAVSFFAQVGVQPATPVADAVTHLVDAGDRMLEAILFHSDHLELSEQFDGTTGFEKSVANLTWSYAAVLCALRSRTRAGGGAAAGA